MQVKYHLEAAKSYGVDYALICNMRGLLDRQLGRYNSSYNFLTLAV